MRGDRTAGYLSLFDPFYPQTGRGTLLSEPSTRDVALTTESLIPRVEGAALVTLCMRARGNGRAIGTRVPGTRASWRGQGRTCGPPRDPYIRERGGAEREMERATLCSGRFAAGMGDNDIDHSLISMATRASFSHTWPTPTLKLHWVKGCTGCSHNCNGIPVNVSIDQEVRSPLPPSAREYGQTAM